jgi:hypothetical protein
MIGTRQSSVPGQVRERPIEFSAGRTAALLRAAGAKYMQMRRARRHAQPQMRMSGS